MQMTSVMCICKLGLLSLAIGIVAFSPIAMAQTAASSSSVDINPYTVLGSNHDQRNPSQAPVDVKTCCTVYVDYQNAEIITWGQPVYAPKFAIDVDKGTNTPTRMTFYGASLNCPPGKVVIGMSLAASGVNVNSPSVRHGVGTYVPASGTIYPERYDWSLYQIGFDYTNTVILCAPLATYCERYISASSNVTYSLGPLRAVTIVPAQRVLQSTGAVGSLNYSLANGVPQRPLYWNCTNTGRDNWYVPPDP